MISTCRAGHAYLGNAQNICPWCELAEARAESQQARADLVKARIEACDEALRHAQTRNDLAAARADAEALRKSIATRLREARLSHDWLLVSNIEQELA